VLSASLNPSTTQSGSSSGSSTGSAPWPTWSRASARSFVLDVEDLLGEIAACKVTAEQLSIDPQAMIIEEEDRQLEGKTLKREIASTGRGVGCATARKVLRNAFPAAQPCAWRETSANSARTFARREA